jgi:hypothetical protein
LKSKEQNAYKIRLLGFVVAEEVGLRRAPSPQCRPPPVTQSRQWWRIDPCADLRSPEVLLKARFLDEYREATYFILLAVQMIGATFFVWRELPAFDQLALNPGEQLPYIPYDNLIPGITVSVIQIAYWYRLLRIPIPFQRSNLFLNHLCLFLGRIGFIFGGALFSVVFFRHLPKLHQDTDLLMLTLRGLLLVGSLFALFCSALELERLGRAFESTLQK